MDINKLYIEKPFLSFKWRWMEFTPVESFNLQDVFLGITRALHASIGDRASDKNFLDQLEVVQADFFAESRINLIPSDPQRNVIRRHGRYWRGLGVLDQTSREIALTPLGDHLATGLITTDQFILERIYNHTLPNPLIDSDKTVKEWNDAGIKIRPLKLILDVLVNLSETVESVQAYVTPEELIKVIIPMSAKISTLTITDFSKGILEYRRNPSSVSHFPDCAERANDKRMAREHLLFLRGFDALEICEDSSLTTNYKKEKYFLGTIGSAIASATTPSFATSTPQESSNSQINAMPDIDLGTVRAKKITEVMTRPNQIKFRKLVLKNFEGKCVITGENTRDVLDACHIISVSEGGHDSVENGVCLRSDIHKLFDNGKVRISESGDVRISPDLVTSPTYKGIERNIDLPANINKEFLRRKWSYGRTGYDVKFQ